MNVVMVGCGDVGTRCAMLLHEAGHTVTGVRRNIEALPEWLPAVSGDVSDADSLAFLGAMDIDVILYILAAASFNETAYRNVYCDGVANTIRALGDNIAKLKRFIYVSSTGVYHQNDGSVVNEDSPVKPNRFNGMLMLEGESLVRLTGIGTCVRFSGIYGPNRLRLINRVAAGQASSQQYTNSGSPVYSNRIHIEDCAGVLAHLVDQLDENETLEEVYLASDSYPATTAEVEQFIAKTLGLAVTPEPAGQLPRPARIAGSKRCDNSRLLGTGYGFIHPSYRSGYQLVIDQLRETAKR